MIFAKQVGGSLHVEAVEVIASNSAKEVSSSLILANSGLSTFRR